MKTVHLLRHAKSSWDNPLQADRDRPLNERGQDQASRMAGHFRRRALRPGLVLCSPAARARQTLDMIAPELGKTPIKVEDGLYEADWTKLLERLRALPAELESVLVVGHNPALEDLAAELGREGGGADLARLLAKYPAGALASLEIESRDWKGAGTAPGRLAGFVVPADLP